MRSTLVPVLVGAGIGAAVLTGSWALQTATLPPPQPGNAAGARAVAWLLRHRLVESTLLVGGRVVHGRCLQTWLPGRHGSVRGALLQLDDGVTVLDAPGRTLDSEPWEPRWLAAAQLVLGGCSRILGSRIAQLVQHHPGVRVARVFAAGRPALALHVPMPGTRLTVFLAARTDRPVALRATGPRFSARSRLRFVRLTPGLLHLIEGRS